MVSITFQGISISLDLQRYTLQLRSAFGTSHSSTTTRSNALITIKALDFVGFGEIGLPPKKKLCYKADYNDIDEYWKDYTSTVERISSQTIVGSFDPFESFPKELFRAFRQSDHRADCLLLLFYALEECKSNDKEYALAARCGIECALLDLWSKMLSLPLYKAIGLDAPLHKPSFYTAALNDNIDLIIGTAKFGYQFTKYTKIKLDSDLEKCMKILNALKDAFSDDDVDLTKKWSIDANAAWTPEISMMFYDMIKDTTYKDIIYMIEQPFPVELCQKDTSKDELLKWKEVKLAYESIGIYIYADESVSIADDIPSLVPYVHGVNVKIEKAGGIRGALLAILRSKEFNLKVWIGMMVASRLSATTSAHMFSLVDYGGDLDGSLLVDEESQIFSGGFQWGKNGEVVFPDDSKGVGVTWKQV